MPKTWYKDPRGTASVDIFDSAVYNPVRDQDDFEDDGAYASDEDSED